jgi:hypothetical protein
MSLKILSHLFTGPLDINTTKVRANQDPAVFAIVCRSGKPWNPEFSLIEVGKSSPDGTEFKNHPNRKEWASLCGGEASVYLLSVPNALKQDSDPRDEIVSEISQSLKPPGGAIPIHGMM